MIEDIIDERKKKIGLFLGEGVNPYPTCTKRNISMGDVLKHFVSFAKAKKRVVCAGRIRGIRDQGKIIFVDLEDFSGKIQVVLHRDDVKNFTLYKKTLDIGDFLEVSGVVFKTKSGEKSIQASSVLILAKSLRPLPSEFYGLEDQEIRLRQRYLDSLLHPQVRDLFMKKAVFWNAIRLFLTERGFLEVDTPVLEATPGGAEAEPFITHHNALDEDFYLRISLEISLKKMIVGGFEKIFEIGRIFRNEGISAEHLQDYTQLEFYWAYADYRDLMKFLEQMYKFVIKQTFGTLTLSWKGKKIQWGKKWAVVDYVSIFKKKVGLDPLRASQKELYDCAVALGVSVQKNLGRGRLIDLLYKKMVRPTLIQPCFLINPPTAIEPLAKRSPDNPDVVERLQIVACGTELGKGFSELNDPTDQRARFEEQMALREAGDVEAQRLDEDFLEAMEYGMPPTAGFGLSERLFAVLADKQIREIVFFPPMRKQGMRKKDTRTKGEEN